MSANANTLEAAVAELVIDEESAFPTANDTIFRMRQEILDGVHWFTALVDAVGDWRIPEERIGERTFSYICGGEAFDWLLLAERLLDEVSDLVPAREIDALIFRGRWPVDMDDDEFADRMGQAKHRAHLNFLYGVLVEQALQLTIEEEVHKENRCQPWAHARPAQETMLERVYGKPREELFAQYYEETGTLLRRDIPYTEWKAFTYWLFKLRLRRQDKARVASDTRKGLAQLTRMELAASERRRGASLDEADFAIRYAQNEPPARGRASTTLAATLRSARGI
ncbi:hypothetical protein AYO38_05685 [bacterium SCGC AG-212-C10]|nr:hypothetical protein AYO38_05685 [bacterium SCGC AG-212-C10]